jgi:outer membrane protein assembly factor BamA
MKFDTGTRYKISELKTRRTGRGVDYVDDALLTELVGIAPGSWYSNYEIKRGTVRLFRTNLFTSASVNGIIADTNGINVPLDITAEIGLMHELSPEIIVNNEDNTFNLGIGLNLTKKNFFGDARKITVGTSIAAQNISEFIKHPSFADSTFYGYADARITIEQPFLFGEPINSKLETYITTQKRKDEYNSLLYGAKFSFDFELPQITYFNSFNTYFNIERNEYTYKRKYMLNLMSRSYLLQGYPQKIADSLAVNKFDHTLGGKLVSANTNATIGANLGAIKTNDLFFPTSGYSLTFLIEDGNSIPYLFSKLAGSEFSRPLFFKAVATAAFFLPVYESKLDAFGMKLKVGQIFTYRGDKANISLNQRLYAGGSNSVRGWPTRELVPRNEQFNLDENLNQEDLDAILIRGATTGGFFLFEGSIESRNRLFGRFGSALFLDYGNTFNSAYEFRYDAIAIAAGFGLRYYSDFAPFRIDFGFKVYDPNDRRPISKKQFWGEILQFHIGIGEAF